jgi:CubicO group peptidase (beta-lactamase class C family)
MDNSRARTGLPRLAGIAAAACLLAASAWAQSTALSTPETVGLSSDRLKRLETTLQQYVDERRIAGVVTLLARNGRIAHVVTAGKRDVERGDAIRPDTIFRIASMSKAVTSVAIMMLQEEGKLLLSDPVSKFIPAFKSTTVMVPPPPDAVPGGAVAAVPAKRSITIRDLLTHTAGISYGTGPAEAQYKAADIYMWYFADKAGPMGPLMDRLATLPFAAQPGERYVYGFNTDILGNVVERVSGESLDDFFRRRIFEPLRMTDTSFFLPVEKRGRLAAVYVAKPDGTIERAPDAGTGQGAYVDGPRQCFSGGAGLLSTAGDYARFLQMLLNGGELDGVRLLSPKTVELMTRNHVGTLFEDGRSGFGLGFRIVEDVGRSGQPGSPGEFGWGGAYFTNFWVDPQEKLVAVFMSQLLPNGGLDLHGKFRALVYQSIVGPATGVAVPVRQRASAR